MPCASRHANQLNAVELLDVVIGDDQIEFLRRQMCGGFLGGGGRLYPIACFFKHRAAGGQSVAIVANQQNVSRTLSS